MSKTTPTKAFVTFMKVKNEGQNALGVHLFAWGSMYSMFYQPEKHETEGNSVRKKLP